MNDLQEAPVAGKHAGGVEGEKHLARASGLRWDGTIETLCGQIRRRSLQPRNGERCKACQEIMAGIIEMETLL